jgi:CRISPR-associated protein (TIGR02584 family)
MRRVLNPTRPPCRFASRSTSPKLRGGISLLPRFSPPTLRPQACGPRKGGKWRYAWRTPKAEKAPMASQLASPGNYERRILLAVTGLSPQVVTETLYALAVQRRPAWIPTEIRIVTTELGAKNVQETLLSDTPGWFHRLRSDYRLPEITFGSENIQVVTGPDGTPLDDIVEDVDNGAVADFITEQVRALTADPAASLHVSIAGGRKTMGFYIGYALSLFGRAQDCLSHVLVSPPFESLPEFFYPAPCMRMIRDRDDREVDAREARVHLGDIPFVRLRESLPADPLGHHARTSSDLV